MTFNFSENTNLSLAAVSTGAVATADFDSDGHTDILLMGYSQSGLISKVYTNDGSGGFSENTNLSLPGVYAGAVATADFDSDGHTDILLTGLKDYQGTPISKVYINNGSGGFSENTTLSLPGLFASGVATADFDSDGHTDILLTGYYDSNSDSITKVYTNNGSGGFSENTTISLAGVNHAAIATADFDSDGHTDILLTGLKDHWENPISKIYTNNGSGGFSENTTVSLTGVGVSAVATADFDSDGDTDILLTGYSDLGPLSQVYTNNGSGGFSENTTVSLAGVGNSAVATADFDSDGDTDILLTGYDNSSLYISKVYINNGSGGFSENTTVSLPGVSGSGVATADFDTDGDTDILLTGATNSGSFISKIYTNTLTPPTLTSFSGPIDTTNEDTTVELTFAELAAQGDEADPDGTVDAFIIQTLSRGILKLGLDAASATPFASGINDTITATTHAYWTPDANSNGTLNAFTVVAKDNNNLKSTPPVAVQVTVNPVNDIPSFTATNPSAINQDAGAQTVSNWATFAPGGGTDESTQTATYQVSNISNTALFAVAPAIDANGNLTYTPAANANGTSTFDVAVKDSGGTANGGVDTSAAQTFTLTVNAVNNAPTVSNISKSGTEDTDLTFTAADFTAAFADADNDSLSKIKVTSLPGNGTLKLSGTAVTGNPEILVSQLGNLTFTPASNFNGTNSFGWNGFDGITYAATGATVTLNIAAVNDAPIVAGTLAAQSATQDAPFSFQFADNTFTDADGDTLTYSATLADGAALPAWLFFDAATGTFSGTATANNLGSISIKVTASDGIASVSDTFALTVSETPAPVILPDLSKICNTDTPVPARNVTEITVNGSNTDDNLIGRQRAETLNGLGGHDFLQGLSGNDNLFGADGNDLIHGHQGADYVDGGAGNDTIHAGQDDDAVLGGDGDDELYGHLGNDVILGGNGNDFANGNQGNDWVNGGDGNDILHGDKGDDTLKGGNGNDQLLGDLGNDIVCAGSGHDFVYGNQGDDTLNGGKDNDFLAGGNGNDWLLGDLGDDTLVGGLGADRFVIHPNAGVDLIVDFTDGEDLIGLAQGLTVENLTLTQGNSGTLIYAGNDLLAILNGVEVSAINQQDFFAVG